MLGFEEAIRRANAALQAGADTESLEEVAAVPKLVKGPCLLNLVWRGKTPEVGLDDAQAMGYKLAISAGPAVHSRNRHARSANSRRRQYPLDAREPRATRFAESSSTTFDRSSAPPRRARLSAREKCRARASQARRVHLRNGGAATEANRN